MHWLANHPGDGPEERQRQLPAARKSGRDWPDPTVAHQERTAGQGEIADQQRDKGESIGISAASRAAPKANPPQTEAATKRVIISRAYGNHIESSVEWSRSKLFSAAAPEIARRAERIQIARLVNPLSLGAPELPNRITMAPLTRRPRRARGRAQRPDGPLLCAARQRRPDHLRGDRHHARRARLTQRAGPVERRPGRRLERRDRGRPLRRRPHPSPNLWHTGRGWAPSPTSVAASRSHRPPPPRPISPHTYEGNALCEARAATRADIGRILDDCARAARNAMPASTGSRSTAPMAIWSTSSCAIPPISATMIMA